MTSFFFQPSTFCYDSRNISNHFYTKIFAQKFVLEMVYRGCFVTELVLSTAIDAFLRKKSGAREYFHHIAHYGRSLQNSEFV
jgi:hypothetical protein